MSGEKEDVKLIGAWPSPFAMRARFALSLKNVPYEFVQVNPFEKTEILVKANPIYKKIPVLIHGDRNICESLIIVEYVDGVWKDNGPSILPSDPYDLATARFWATFIDDKYLQLSPILKGVASAETKAAAVEKMFGELEVLEGALEKCSKGKGFFGGDTMGLVDICLGPFIPWFRAAGMVAEIEFFDKEKLPLLAGWAQRFGAEAAAKEVLPDTDKMIDFFQNVFAKVVLKGGKPSRL